MEKVSHGETVTATQDKEIEGKDLGMKQPSLRWAWPSCV